MKLYCLLLAAFTLGQLPLAYGEEIRQELDSKTDDVWFGSYYYKKGVNDYQLRAGGWGDSHRFLLRFDITRLPKKADKATLWLYNFGNSTPVEMRFWRVTSSWNESSTGWDNMPNKTDSESIPAPKKNAWYSVDITDHYNDWQSGENKNYGLMFSPRSPDNQFNNFYSSDVAVTSYRPYLVVRHSPPSSSEIKFAFPLLGYSPYTTRVVGIYDNNRNYGTIQAYNGVIAEKKYGEYVYSTEPLLVVGFKNKERSIFTFPYLNYDDEVNPSGNHYLFYDNHTGYDYAFPGINKMPFRAAADGTLLIATTDTKKNGSVLWRDTSYPVPGGDDALQWSTNHAFYILHKKDYSTWYLHCSDIEPILKAQLLQNGSAKVTKGQIIGYVGSFGAGDPHLHMGLKKGNDRADIYGNGSRSSVLWELTPP